MWSLRLIEVYTTTEGLSNDEGVSTRVDTPGGLEERAPNSYGLPVPEGVTDGSFWLERGVLGVVCFILGCWLVALWRDGKAREAKHAADIEKLSTAHASALAASNAEWAARYAAQEASCAKEVGELRGQFAARVELHVGQVVELYERRVIDAKAFQDTLRDLVEGSSIAITGSTAASNAVHNALGEVRAAMNELREFLRQVREEIRVTSSRRTRDDG
jgi:hypothetical protein